MGNLTNANTGENDKFSARREKGITANTKNKNVD